MTTFWLNIRKQEIICRTYDLFHETFSPPFKFTTLDDLINDIFIRNIYFTIFLQQYRFTWYWRFYFNTVFYEVINRIFFFMFIVGDFSKSLLRYLAFSVTVKTFLPPGKVRYEPICKPRFENLSIHVAIIIGI